MARWRKLGVISGSGVLPLRIAETCAQQGRLVHVIALQGIADADFSAFQTEFCGIAEAGRILKALGAAGCDAVTLAGVVRRPDFRHLRPDWRGARLLPRVVAAAAEGDGALLRVLVDTLEAEGFTVVGADEIVSEFSVRPGPIGAVAPNEIDLVDIAKGAALVAALGPFDVGQGAVVANGFVLAVEAAEGTDAMLERCAALIGAFTAAGEGTRPRSGVLVKRPKPGQERRVDLPTIGVETIVRAHACGLAGVAVEAGGAIIIDPEKSIAEADRRGLFIYGFSAPEH